MKTNTTEAIILAGGFGTRLRPVVSDTPKPMAPVKGKPFIQYLFDWLLDNGIHKAVLSVGYLYEAFIDHYGDRYQDLSIAYSVEDTPLGTGGAVGKALSCCESPEVLAFNGDTYFPVPLPEFQRAHRRFGSAITLALREVKNADRYGTVRTGPSGRVTDFLEKGSAASGLINGGVYLIDRTWFQEHFPAGEKFSLETAVFPAALAEGRLYGLPFDRRFIDIGIPEDYQLACESFF